MRDQVFEITLRIWCNETDRQAGPCVEGMWKKDLVWFEAGLRDDMFFGGQDEPYRLSVGWIGWIISK